MRGTVISHRTRQFSGITWISSARDEKEEEEEEEEEEDEEGKEEEDTEEAVGNDDDDDGDNSFDEIECKEEDRLGISLFRIRT